MNRYKDILVFRNKDKKLYKRNVIFPEIKPLPSDLYVIATAGDRFDTLALQFYQDSSLWWIIAGVNNAKKDSLAVKPGIQLRIPVDVNQVLQEFNELNSER